MSEIKKYNEFLTEKKTREERKAEREERREERQKAKEVKKEHKKEGDQVIESDDIHIIEKSLGKKIKFDSDIFKVKIKGDGIDKPEIVDFFKGIRDYMLDKNLSDILDNVKDIETDSQFVSDIEVDDDPLVGRLVFKYKENVYTDKIKFIVNRKFLKDDENKDKFLEQVNEFIEFEQTEDGFTEKIDKEDIDSKKGKKDKKKDKKEEKEIDYSSINFESFEDIKTYLNGEPVGDGWKVTQKNYLYNGYIFYPNGKFENMIDNVKGSYEFQNGKIVTQYDDIKKEVIVDDNNEQSIKNAYTMTHNTQVNEIVNLFIENKLWARFENTDEEAIMDYFNNHLEYLNKPTCDKIVQQYNQKAKKASQKSDALLTKMADYFGQKRQSEGLIKDLLYAFDSEAKDIDPLLDKKYKEMEDIVIKMLKKNSGDSTDGGGINNMNTLLGVAIVGSFGVGAAKNSKLVSSVRNMIKRNNYVEILYNKNNEPFGYRTIMKNKKGDVLPTTEPTIFNPSSKSKNVTSKVLNLSDRRDKRVFNKIVGPKHSKSVFSLLNKRVLKGGGKMVLLSLLVAGAGYAAFKYFNWGRTQEDYVATLIVYLSMSGSVEMQKEIKNAGITWKPKVMDKFLEVINKIV